MWSDFYRLNRLRGVGFVPDVGMAPPKILRHHFRYPLLIILDPPLLRLEVMTTKSCRVATVKIILWAKRQHCLELHCLYHSNSCFESEYLLEIRPTSSGTCFGSLASLWLWIHVCMNVNTLILKNWWSRNEAKLYILLVDLIWTWWPWREMVLMAKPKVMPDWTHYPCCRCPSQQLWDYQTNLITMSSVPSSSDFTHAKSSEVQGRVKMNVLQSENVLWMNF